MLGSPVTTTFPRERLAGKLPVLKIPGAVMLVLVPPLTELIAVTGPPVLLRVSPVAAFEKPTLSPLLSDVLVTFMLPVNAFTCKLSVVVVAVIEPVAEVKDMFCALIPAVAVIEPPVVSVELVRLKLFAAEEVPTVSPLGEDVLVIVTEPAEAVA